MRSENGYGLLRTGLKTGVGSGMFWSEIGSGFGNAGGTPPPKISTSTPPGIEHARVLHAPSDSFVVNLICSFNTVQKKANFSPKAPAKERSRTSSKYYLVCGLYLKSEYKLFLSSLVRDC